MGISSIDGYETIKRSCLSDEKSGILTFLEFESLPFMPARIYWLSSFSDSSERGNHAHKKLRQIFIVISGIMEVDLFQGDEKRTLTIDKDSDYLIIPKGTWRVLKNKTKDTVLLVLADQPYDESDYIRSWDHYLQWFTTESKKTSSD